jgi:hypothetical protein
MAIATATLQGISLLQVPAGSGQPARLALEVSGSGNGVSLLLGAGNAPDIDVLLEDDPLDQSLRQAAVRESGGAWFGTGLDATLSNGIPDRPVWFAVLRADRTDLFGIQPLQPFLGVAGVLEVEGPCALRTRVSVQGRSVVRAECVLTGRLRFRADLGPVRIANSTAAFRLTAGAVSLDDAWAGSLECTVESLGRLNAFGIDITAPQTINLQARCHAAAGASSFQVDSLHYSHTLSEIRLANSEMKMETLSLTAQTGAWDANGFALFEAAGAGMVTLPAAFGAALVGSEPRLEGSVAVRGVRQGSGYSTRFTAQLRGLQLRPAINPLGFTDAGLRLVADEQHVWLDASLRQSWDEVARRLQLSSIVRLPQAAGLPELQCSFRLESAGSSPRVALELEVLSSGRLWLLPLAASDWRIRLVALLAANEWAWQAEGSGRVQTLEPLASIVPLQGTTCTFSLAAVPGEVPELFLTASGGLPAVELPPFQRGAVPLQLLQPVSMSLALAEIITVSLEVRLVANLAGIAASAGLPAEWDGFLWKLVSTVRGTTGTLTLSIPVSGNGAVRLSVAFTAPDNAPEFDPLQAFARIMPVPPPAAAASHSSPPLLTLKPRSLSFVAELPPEDDPALDLRASAICSVLGETFEADVLFAVRQGVPEATILAAHHDPILVRIPSPDNGALLNTLDADFNRVLNMYSITSASRRAQLQSVLQQLETLFGIASHNTLMAFEIVDLAIAFRPTAAADPVTMSGGIRMVQYPPVLDCLLGEPSPTLKLGTSGTSFFIEVTPVGSQPEPLISIPVADRGNVKVFLHNLRIGYRWDPPAVDFALSSTIDSPSLPFQGGVGLQLPPQSVVDLAISAPTPPPFPIPQWRADFLGQHRQPSNRGIELIFGQSLENRALTVYLRETVFSPTFYFLMPGCKIDGGAYLGAPPPSRGPNAFHCEFRLGGAQWITMSPVMGLMLNPWAALPPFLTANPPFWVIPGILMGDFFTDSSGATGIEFSANIPLLAGFEIVFKRPLPNITLQMLLEIAALAAQEFSVEIPTDSALKNLFYAELTGTVTLHAVKTLFGDSAGAITASVRFNIVDLINSVLRLMKSGREVLDAGAGAAQRAAALAAQVFDDPELVIRMIPRQQRGFALDTVLSVPDFAFSCHLSAYLLLPDELEAELIAYHENKRKKGKGLGALRESPGSAGVGAGRAEWNGLDVVTRDRLVNASDWTGEKLIAKIQKLASARMAAASSAPVEKLRNQLAVKVSADAVPALLAATTPSARQSVLKQWGLEDALPAVERLFSTSRRQTVGLTNLIRQTVRTSAKVNVEVRAELPDAAAGLAKRLLSAAFDITSNGIVTARTGRGQSIRNLSRTKLLGGRLERSADQVIAARLPGRALNAQELTVWRAETERVLESEIRTAVVIGQQAGVAAGRAVEVVVELAGPASGLRGFIPGDLRRFETLIVVFDGKRWSDGLSEFLDPRGRVPDSGAAVGKAEVRNGFVIRTRAASRTNAPDFQVPVQARNARFDVRLQEGAYRLIVPGQASVTIPSTLVNTIPPGPKRATQLRQLLVIEENRSTRNLTEVDRNYLEKDPYIEIAGLYQTTLFSRPEYQIRPTGGVRGSTSLADLLRRPGGQYEIPGGPSVMAGVMVHLRIGTLDFDAQFCGYIAPGKSQPERSAMMLMFAHTEQSIPFGPFSLKLNGDFRLLAGRNSFTFSDETIMEGIGFRGSASLYSGAHKVLSGSVETESAVKSGRRLHMNLIIRLHLDVAFDDVEIAGFDLAKGWIRQDLELAVSLTDHLSASLTTDITFSYKVKEIVWRDEDHWVCGELGPFRHCEKITVPEPQVEWGAEKTVSGKLSIELDTSIQNPRLEIKASVPSLGLNDLKIPDFFTAVV